jgi:hypothetical protein
LPEARKIFCQLETFVLLEMLGISKIFRNLIEISAILSFSLSSLRGVKSLTSNAFLS